MSLALASSSFSTANATKLNRSLSKGNKPKINQPKPSKNNKANKAISNKKNKVIQGPNKNKFIRRKINKGGVTPTPVPEPLTILGTVVVLGFGGLCQSEISKKRK